MGSVENTAVPVLIVDDQAPFRGAARAVLSLMPGFEVVGEAESGEQAVDMVASLHPGLVLMDINMDGINGIEATRRITADHPGTVVVLASTYREEDLPSDAMTSGAAAYVNKEELDPFLLLEIWEHRANGASPPA
jgi:two-component system, NarL family, invasion response regulator UvrY